MATWKLSKLQLEKVAEYVESVNKHNKYVRIISDVRNGVLLGFSVRFLAPRSWHDKTPENERLEELIYEEIEKRSRYRLFPERSELLRRGILELKCSSAYRNTNERHMIAALKFIADDMVDVMIGRKTLD